MEKKKTAERFYTLTESKVLQTFHVKSIRQCTHLDTLLDTSITLTAFEDGILNLALERYKELALGWNEEELKMHFISPIFSVANPNLKSVCKTFFERPLSGVIDNYELNIVTDCMVASYDEAGLPVNPYFFLQERFAARFKQAQRFGKTDPQGQMLAAMLLAQQINDDKKPIYGCYVIERNWFFTTLNGLDYCISRQFDSSDKANLLQIVYILRKLKDLIVER